MRAAVVGGGLAGLVAAWRLASRGRSVMLFEATDRLGGQVRTVHQHGCTVELGAEGFPARRHAVRELCGELGIAPAILPQRARRSLLLRHGRLLPLAPGEAARRLGMAMRDSDLGHGLHSLRPGMGFLVETLAGRLREVAEVRTGCRVTAIDGVRGTVTVEGEDTERVDGIVLAVPPPEAAQFLPVTPGAGPLDGIPLVHSVTVTLAYPATAFELPFDAAGFVPEDPSPDGFRACAFVSRKFPEHAPEGYHLLRVFFRAPGETVGDADAFWRDRAHLLVATTFGSPDPPAIAWVGRWPRAMVERPADLTGTLRHIRGRLTTPAGLELAGAILDGGGLEAAVRSGTVAADRLRSRTDAAALSGGSARP